MARGRLISLWRRWNQLTAGLSTAARKRAAKNQATKVLSCQSTKRAPSTTAAVKRATATVRITWGDETRTHKTPSLGTGASGFTGSACGGAWVTSEGLTCASVGGLSCASLCWLIIQAPVIPLVVYTPSRYGLCQVRSDGVLGIVGHLTSRAPERPPCRPLQSDVH